MTTASPPTPSKKGRSPSYPGTNLQEALRKADIIQKQDGKAYASVDTILHHWGYKPKSGGGLVTLAALIKFGLLVDDGAGDARRARLTEDALRILLDKRDNSEERAELIRKAALTPQIHREVWNHYRGALPSDATLKHHLIFDRSFTPGGADDFISQFRATIAFAALATGDSISSTTEDKQEKGDSDAAGKVGETPRILTFPLPIAPNEYATIEAAFPITEAKWTQMLLVLNAMKPALIRDEPATSPTLVVLGPAVSADADIEPGLTAEAEQLITKVDGGGVPAFVTPELQRIAEENGVSLENGMTPNEIIDALKLRL